MIILSIILLAVVVVPMVARTRNPTRYQAEVLTQTAVPYNVTTRLNSVVFNVTNGTVGLDATNYTEYFSDDLDDRMIVQINDNTSYEGTPVIIYDDYTGTIRNNSQRLVVGAIVALIVIAFVYLVLIRPTMSNK